MWNEYVLKRQTLENLSETSGLSKRQLSRQLKKIASEKSVAFNPVSEPNKEVVVVMDVTGFEEFGVMVFRSWTDRKNLLWYFVQSEKIEDYIYGLGHLESLGYKIYAVVCDGKRWLPETLDSMGYKVQTCQFHLVKTVTRYLTRRPELPAGQELRSLILKLKYFDEKTFENELKNWHEKWKVFLQEEKTTNPFNNRWQFTHKRVRSAYRAITIAKPYLFTFEKHKQLDITKTTNTLDGSFSHLKQKVNTHRGINSETKKKMIETILSIPSKPRRQKQSVK